MFGLLTACCFAAQFIATRRVAGDDPFTSLIWSGAVGTACLTLALPFILPPALPVLRELSLLDWSLLISTGITGGLGHLFQIAAYRRAPATLAPFIYLQIISATTVGWLVWGHFPGPADLAGHRCHLRQRHGHRPGGMAARPGRRPPASGWQLASVRSTGRPGPGSRTMPVAFSLPTRRPRAGFQT